MCERTSRLQRSRDAGGVLRMQCDGGRVQGVEHEEGGDGEGQGEQ